MSGREAGRAIELLPRADDGRCNRPILTPPDVIFVIRSTPDDRGRRKRRSSPESLPRNRRWPARPSTTRRSSRIRIGRLARRSRPTPSPLRPDMTTSRPPLNSIRAREREPESIRRQCERSLALAPDRFRLSLPRADTVQWWPGSRHVRAERGRRGPGSPRESPYSDAGGSAGG